MNHTSFIKHDSSILIVDDLEENLKLLSETLMNAGYRVRPALSGRIALQSAKRRPPDLVLLDIRMPEMDGLQVCKRLKADEKTTDIPVIFISALGEIEDKIKAFEAGGVDYITKPFEELEILSRVKTHLTLHTMHQHLETVVQNRTSELESANRTLRLISHSNKQLVNIHSEKELLQSFCQSLIDIGGYPFCWIGTPKKNKQNRVSILESAAADTQDLSHLARLEGETRSDLSVKAFNFRQQEIENDPAQEIISASWRDAALDGGFSSCFALPLEVAGKGFGTCSVYAYEQNFFDATEVELLMELAKNLSLGLHMVREKKRRQSAEAALVDSEKHYRTLFESAGDAIFIMEAEGKGAGRIIEANLEGARMHGYDIQELIGQPINILDTPEASQDVPNKIRRMMDGERVQANIDHVRKNGDIFPVEVSACALDLGHKKYILAIYRDVSEREKNRAALKRLATVVEQSAEGVMITDADGVIQYVNPALEHITGYSREEIAGKNPGMLKSGKHSRSFYKELWQTIQHGEAWRGRLINKRKDGRLYHEDASISPIFDTNGKISGYVSVKRDITEQLALEKRLGRIQKMEALGTLAGGISHDFNNILYPIIGYAELILTGAEPDTPNYRRLEEILSCAKHANELVGQISAFSRRSESTPRPMRLQPVIREVLKPFRAFLPSDITLQNTMDDACGLVKADPTHIKQIVLNLVTNAVHAMEETGGLLKIELTTFLLKDSKLCSEGLKPGEYVCLSVSDEGKGIEQSVKEKLFDPYFTTKEKGKGTGLGLAVVHGIVTGYGGAIDVKSNKSNGTRFKIYFPLSKEHSSAAEEPEMKDLPSGIERIMVVDDDVHNINLLEDSLTILGYYVTKYTDSLEALAAFQEDPGRFKLVLTDYAMPRMNGDILAQELLALVPDLPVILCTGHSEQFSARDARAAGICDYLRKPLPQGALARSVRKALDRDIEKERKAYGSNTDH